MIAGEEKPQPDSCLPLNYGKDLCHYVGALRRKGLEFFRRGKKRHVTVSRNRGSRCQRVRLQDGRARLREKLLFHSSSEKRQNGRGHQKGEVPARRRGGLSPRPGSLRNPLLYWEAGGESKAA